MHSIEIPEIGFRTEIPSCVEELSPAEFRHFVQMLIQLDNDDITWDGFRVLMLNKLIKFKRPFTKLKASDKTFVLSEIYRLSELMDSFAEITTSGDDKQVHVRLNFIKNPLPFYERFRGPDDALANCTFQQFIDAHHAYCSYADNQDIESLNLLFSVLYRHNQPLWKKSSRLYPVYSDDELLVSQKYAGQVPYDIKYGVLLWFRGCEEFLQKGDVPVGDRIINLSSLYGSGDSNVTDDTGLIGILYTIAESGVFGPAAEVARTNLYDVLIRIYQSIQLSKQLKK